MNRQLPPACGRADQFLLAASVAALAVALFNFFWSGNGIHSTGGALLVVISSALMAGAAGCLLFVSLPRWLYVTLAVLVALDIVGTAFAAYMLEADILLAVTGLILLGWIAQRFQSPSTSYRNPQPADLR
jgi:hypothetical protein